MLLCIAVIVGLLFGGGSVFAAPEPEEPTPTVQPEPEEPPSPTATLMVYTTVLTEQPRSGSEVKAQIWVTSTGASADNVTLVLAAGADITLTPQCTLAAVAGTTCRLGALDAQGVTIPLTLQTPRSTTTRTITLTATATAAPAHPSQRATTIALAPVAAPTPKPTKTTASPKPTKTTRSPKPANTTPAPQPTNTPAAPVVPPPLPATAPTAPDSTPSTFPSPATTLSSPPVLPQIAPGPVSAFPDESAIIVPSSPSPTSTLSLTPVSSTLTAAHGLWLGALLTAIIASLLTARRARSRSSLSGRRRKTGAQSRHRRYAPQGTRLLDEQTTHDEPTELPAAISDPPPWPMKTDVNAKDAQEIEAIHESLQYFKTISVSFSKSETTTSAQTRIDWHNVPVEAETISTPRHSQTEPDASHAVRAGSLSWIWTIIKKGPAGSNSSEFNEPAPEIIRPDGGFGPSRVQWADDPN